MDLLERETLITKRISESRDVLDAVLYRPEVIEGIGRLADQCTNSINKGGKIVFFGNGGSAADAQHLATELVSKYLAERDPIAALALTTDTSTLTAVANDYDFTRVFSRQVEALVTELDVVVGITTSGNSTNVVAGLAAARHVGAFAASLTGLSGGLVVENSDLCLRVPSESTPLIQQVHITLGHVLCELIEGNL